jgi:DNA topoisomerase-2
MSKNTKSDALKYDKKTPREHVLIRPDTYIGDIEPTSEVMWVFNEDKIVKETITYTPGFLKVFDELIVNARDASVNDKSCDTIKIEYNIEEGYISVWNNGDKGIPVEEHPEHKMLVPTMIFGELLTSSNYNDDEERTTGGRNGYGSKCLSLDTNILLWNGSIKKASEITLNDKLIGDDGKIRNIKKIIKGKGKMYDIIQSHGDTYTVNDEHILTLHMPDHKVIFWNSGKYGWSVLWWEDNKINCKTFRALESDIIECPECKEKLSSNLLRHYKRKHGDKKPPKTERKKPTIIPEQSEQVMQARKEVEEFCKTISDNNIFDISIKDYIKLNETTKKRLAGIRGQCVQWEKKDVELDPYVLGLWLGDGMQRGYSYACYGEKDPEIIDYLNEWGKNNDATIKQSGKYSYNIVSTTNFQKKGCSPLKNKLDKYNLINNKHIPKDYLINDRNTRLNVLAGIIDTDGCVSREGTRVTITQGLNHKQLAKDIVYLARSLGFSCQFSMKKTSWNYNGELKEGMAYNINISGDIDDIPTKLPRKKCSSTISKNTSKSTGYIEIKESNQKDFVGIEIDENQRFVINDFTVTHNCANIFSSRFIVEIDDAKREKRFKQEWTENMLNAHKPKLSSLPSKVKSSVKVTFYPDFGRFKIKDLNNDHLKLFHRRAIDIAGVTDNKLKVYFNDKKVEANTFKSYVELYYKDQEIFYDLWDRWSVACLYKPDAGGEVISFANGISTYRGGTHCNHVIDNIVKTLINDYIKKKDKDIKVTPTLLKENLVFFINSTIVNPAFSSQTKDTLTTKVEKFGSKYEPTQAFLKKLAKCGIVEQIIQLIKFKENSNLKKTDGKKQAKITGIPKLEDANKSGTKESSKCTLILTEGDSAKAFAMAGLGVVGRDYYGVFPLKGKLLNVREATVKQLSENEEINNLKQIVGLRMGVDYSVEANFNQLRYGRILILTDQDVDGSHIKGLFMNFVHCTWPSLLQKENFITSLSTPIVKAFKGKDVKIFYNLTEYEDWKESDESKGYKTKYYKGLGTSTSEEAKDYFVDIEDKLISYFWQSAKKELDIDDEEKVKQPDDDAITLAFDKTRADDRKKWLMGYDKNEILKYEDKEVSYSDFIHLDLKHFSNDDNSRSIPSLIDGFKPSQRKILYGAFLRGLDKDEVKVAQLSGFVSDKAAYHHGEMSLNGAIIGMAQNFVGSNNINVLKPNGQFGTRLRGGKDAASPRYIWTKFEDLTSKIFMVDDEPILKKQDDDGLPIEPETYAPIIPMILVNGTKGIGTGFSTTIPPFNPKDIVKSIRNKIKGKPIDTLVPWWQGFTGTVSDNKVEDETQTETGTTYTVSGKWKIKGNKLIITELPIGEWTSDYKEFLEKMLDDEPTPAKKDAKGKAKPKKEKKDNPFKGYTDNNTDMKVHFELDFEDGFLEEMDSAKLEKMFHLSKRVSIGNMHLYNYNGTITRYDTINDIIDEFYNVRLELYQKRKDHKLENLEQQLKLISWKVKFILMIIEKKLEVNNKKKAEIEEKLVQHKFPKIDGSYNYLLSMPIYNLTQEKIEELKKQEKEKQTEFDTLVGMKPQELWINDLDVFESAYDSWMEVKEEKESNSVSQKKVKKIKK